jgi:hypothetical protein
MTTEQVESITIKNRHTGEIVKDVLRTSPKFSPKMSWKKGDQVFPLESGWSEFPVPNYKST